MNYIMNDILNETIIGWKWTIIVIIIILIIIYLKSKKAYFKGVSGERIVSQLIHRLPEEKYMILDNVMLSDNSKTTQIDHIIVSVYGIFVIETKNYKGSIYGNEKKDKWIKYMYGKKYYFHNPIWQNYGHIKFLQSLLLLPEEYFHSIIVFSNESKVKVNANIPVINMKDLIETIKKYNNVFIEQNRINEIKSKIQQANIDSFKNRKEHVKVINEKIKSKEEKIHNNICPRCNAELIIRDGKFGKFMGCSNYPKCRYTNKDIK